MSAKRTYIGESRKSNLQEAVEAALGKLSADITEGGVRDGLAAWTITETSGEYGGIAGSRVLRVKITAERSPEW